MLLIVGEGASADRLTSLLEGRDPARVTTIGGARERCADGDPAAVVVALDPADDDVEAFVRDVRAGAFDRPDLPIIAVTDAADRAGDLEVDEVVETPLDADEVEAAVERALLVEEYRDAVDALFDACRERIESGVASVDLGAARARADDRLRALHTHGERIPFERLIDGA